MFGNTMQIFQKMAQAAEILDEAYKLADGETRDNATADMADKLGDKIKDAVDSIVKELRYRYTY